jgi:hypothetical protein
VAGEYKSIDMEDHNARFIRINVLTQSSATSIGFSEVDVWGDDTPIGSEPPAPAPPPGVPPPPGSPPPPPPPPGDPNYVYQESKHVFNINFQSSQTGDVDLCNPVPPSPPDEESEDTPELDE